MKHQPHARPYWHVDLKWIFGILFVLGLGVVGALYLAATLTSERVAIPVATQITALMFSRNGTAATADIEEFKRKAVLLPGDKYEPLPGVFITKAELETLPPEELRTKIFSQVVTPYYELGAKGVAAKNTADPLEQSKIEKQAGLLAFINKSNHDKLQQALWVSLGLLIIPLIGLVYFSAGFGRLVSPGIILSSLALPGAVVALVFQIASHSSKPLPGSGAGGTSPIPVLSPESLQLIVGTLLPGPVSFFAIGIALLLAAAIGKSVSHRRQGKLHFTES